MARDFKLNKINNKWRLSIKNGDIESTNSIDTAVYMSIFCEKRADSSQVSNPLLRRGHFSNIFKEKEIGSLLWLYSAQAINNTRILSLIKSTVNDGLRWLVDNDIMKEIKVEAKKNNNTEIQVEVELKGSIDSRYYNLLVAV